MPPATKPGILASAPVDIERSDKPTFKEYLSRSAVPREVIDRFLAGPSWAQFDPELGYVLGNYLPADGIDKSATISTIQPNGARTSFLYAGKKARINTYGDSFTQCHQVSDGETWQEYLAAHLGEPVGNFGMGGYGVYQAYRRMIREERSEHGAEYLVFYIWGDDHIRSLLRCRHAIIYPRWDHHGGAMFHNNFWPNVEMDQSTGRLVEKENLLPDRKSLYRMSDPKWMADHLLADLALQLYAFHLGYICELDRDAIDILATRLDFTMDWNDRAGLTAQSGKLLDRYSLRATRLILEKAREFAQQKNKKLLVVLFDPYRAMNQLRQHLPRYDQEIVDFLAAEKFSVFDMNEVHVRDLQRFNLPYGEYMKLYLNGHYNPRGNHFFAHSIKDKIVDWLDPKPLTYQKRDPKTIDFKGYLKQAP